MESLASFFVVLVTFANTFLPQANLPQVLGVKIAQTTSVTESVDTTVAPIDTSPTTGVQTASTLEDVRLRRRAIIEEFHARRRQATEEAKVRREEFRDRLAEIRDLRKRGILENLNEKLSQVHNRWLDHWNKILDRLSAILAKIETRSEKLAGAGCDISGVPDAIATAEGAIADAQEVLNAQAGKEYVIEISDEEGFGQDVRALIAQFKTDKEATLEAVKAARKTVHDAFAAVRNAHQTCSQELTGSEEATEEGGINSP